MTQARRIFLGLALFLAGVVAGTAGVLVWQRWHAQPLLPTNEIQATLYLPLVDNAGQRFSDDRWQDAIRLLATEFGGATVGAEHEGWWRDAGGQIRREPVRSVVVTFHKDRLMDFEDAFRRLAKQLSQDAVYFRLEEVHVKTVSPDDGG